MAKKLVTQIKLQIAGGAANPAPPVGPALGQHGVNIQAFCKEFSDKTQDKNFPPLPRARNIIPRQKFVEKKGQEDNKNSEGRGADEKNMRKGLPFGNKI